MTLESATETRLRRSIAAAGGQCLKFVPAEAGAPDRIVLLNGSIYLVELKQERGRLRPIQRVWIERAREAGVEVDVIYGEAGLDDWLRERGVAPLPSQSFSRRTLRNS